MHRFLSTPLFSVTYDASMSLFSFLLVSFLFFRFGVGISFTVQTRLSSHRCPLGARSQGTPRISSRALPLAQAACKLLSLVICVLSVFRCRICRCALEWIMRRSASYFFIGTLGAILCVFHEITRLMHALPGSAVHV